MRDDTRLLINAFLVRSASSMLLAQIDEGRLVPKICRVVRHYGCYPINSLQYVDETPIVFGPAVAQNPDGTYGVYNCDVFDKSSDAARARRTSLRLCEAVRLYLAAFPFGTYRGYNWW